MFLGRMTLSLQSCWTGTAPSFHRFFSQSSVVEAGYKLKSHSGAKKRWRSLASGTAFKRAKAYKSHLNVSKGSSRINRLSTTAYATPTQAVKLKKVLLPYGSN